MITKEWLKQLNITSPPPFIYQKDNGNQGWGLDNGNPFNQVFYH